jgi:hypothetical protein
MTAIALAAWPVQSIRSGIGGDWSWMTGLAYAAEHGMRFGDQIVWTYGPLGFLNTWYRPVLVYDDILLLSWLYIAVLQVLLAYALLTALKRALPLPAAVVIAAVVLALTVDLVPALAFGLCALALTRTQEPHDGAGVPWLPLMLGALTGIALLGKVNQGVELLALTAVTLAAVARRRDVVAFVASLLAFAVGGWFASGQTPADVWPYIRNGAEVVAGYAAAMGTSDPDHGWSYAAAFALGALGLALWWAATRALPRRRHAALLCLYALYAGFAFKEGFTRQDPGHLEVFFGNMLVPFALLPLRAARQLLPLALAGIVGCAVVVGALLGGHHVVRKVNVVANVSAAADQVRTLASPARRAAMVAGTRAEIVAVYAVPASITAAIGRRPVMMWPYLLADLAYGYGWNLRPLPSFEPFGTYTPALDRLGARMLASSRAPSRIVRVDLPGFFHARATFEAPLATLAIFCRYRQIAASGAWQALARSDNRCGAPRPLDTRTAAWGDSVRVPAPRTRDALVIAHVEGTGPQGLERLEALLLRLRRRWIELDGRRSRLVAATAADGLLLSAPRRLDYRGGLAMAPHPRTIAVGRAGSQPDGTITYRFEEVPLRSIPPVARAP